MLTPLLYRSSSSPSPSCMRSDLHLLLFPLLSLCLRLHLFSYYQNNPTKGFNNHPVLGTLPEFLKNRHRFLDWTVEILGRCPSHTAVFHRPGKAHGIITANPSNVEYILETNFENYPKGTDLLCFLKIFLGGESLILTVMRGEFRGKLSSMSSTPDHFAILLWVMSRWRSRRAITNVTKLISCTLLKTQLCSVPEDLCLPLNSPGNSGSSSTWEQREP